MKNLYIQQLFTQFNKKYFKNELPEIKVSYATKPIGTYAFFYSGQVEAGIELEPVLKNNQMALEGILLHEMIHCALWVKYGKLEGGLYTDLWANSNLWNVHNYEFTQLEKRFNKLHFGDTKGHEKYVKIMEREFFTKPY